MFKDLEKNESKMHETSEAKSFEKKENMNLVQDSADKRALRKQAMGRYLGAK